MCDFAVEARLGHGGGSRYRDGAGSRTEDEGDIGDDGEDGGGHFVV
jgi:hypothetical protein